MFLQAILLSTIITIVIAILHLLKCEMKFTIVILFHIFLWEITKYFIKIFSIKVFLYTLIIFVFSLFLVLIINSIIDDNSKNPRG